MRLADLGVGEGASTFAKASLDMLIEPTGLKPSPGDANVFTQPIPDSSSLIRLFPGCTEVKEYYLDFVRTATGEAVNPPFPEFSLFSVPGPDAPVGLWPVMSARSLEISFDMPSEKIPPKEEKFVFSDGQTCILRRPDHQDVQFIIPNRRPRNPPPKLDERFLEFPRYVEYD
ncbi:hypothetical protein BD413DRAFT_276020 [Trametes elegans]|nr:hypothetical protein BD413DRAFT_276020 [Trametes elegans]